MKSNGGSKVAHQVSVLGRTIKAIRKHQGVTQEQLAERVGMRRSYLVRVERNPEKSSLDLLSRISVGLGIPVWKILKFADRIKET